MNIDNTLQQAQEAYQRKDYSAAERLYEQVLAADADHEEALFMRAMIAQAQEDWDTAGEFMHRTLNANPGNATHHFTYGQIQMRRGDFDRAYAGLSKAVELDPNYLAAHASLGYTELRRKNWSAAEKQLRLALKVEEDNVQLLVYLGMALMEQGETEKAINYLEHAVKVAPDQGLAHYHLGRAMLANGQAAFAIQCFDNALDKLPKIAGEVLYQRGRAEEASGQTDKAVKTYHQALDKPGRSPGAVAALARLYRLAVHPDAAEQVLREFPVPEGEFDAVELEWAEVLLAKNRARAAARRLRSLGEPASRTHHVLLAKALFACDELGDALEALEPEQAPDDPVTQALYARILHAQDKPSAAEKVLDRLLEQSPPAIDAVLLRAERLLRTSQAEDAVALLKQAADRADLVPVQRQAVLRALGDARFAQGNREAAIDAWNRQVHIPALITQLDDEPVPQWTYAEAGFEESATSAMDAAAIEAWPTLTTPKRAVDPVFVYGWPGTGREHLLRALHGDPNLHVVNDSVLEQRARRQLVTTPRGAVALGQINQEALRQTHRRYRQMLLASGPAWGDQQQVIDGLVFTAAGLPAISRYFPGARIIALMGDDEQMVLSWRRLGVAVDDDLKNRLSLEQEQLQQCRAALDLQWLALDVKDLAQQPDSILAQISEFLGLDDSVTVDAGLSRMRVPLHK